MKSIKISNYLKGKIPATEIKKVIYESLHSKIANSKPQKGHYEIQLIDTGKKLPVTAVQFLHLLDDFIQGEINRYELYFLLDAISASKDLVVDNESALNVLYQLASPSIKSPISINYIKSLIYRP